MWVALVLLVLFIGCGFLAVVFKEEWEQIEHRGLKDDSDYRYYYDLFKKWEKRCQRTWIASFCLIPAAIYVEALLIQV